MSGVLTATAGGFGHQELLGVAVAVVSAGAYVIGYVLEKQALVDLPALQARPASVLRTGLSSRRWVAGFVTMLGALALQVVALTLAPVAVVQPILAGGLVALAAVGGSVLQESLDRRQLLSLALVLAAVVAVAVSARTGEKVAGGVHAGRFALLAAPVALAAVISAWTGIRSKAGSAPLLGVTVGAGLMYGLGAVAEKAVATRLVSDGMVQGAIRSLATPYPWLFVLATAAGMMVFQVGLQRHPASMMATFTNVTSSVCALVGASVIFGESLLPGGWWSAARVGGFAAVLAAVALMATGSPAPEDVAGRQDVAYSS